MGLREANQQFIIVSAIIAVQPFDILRIFDPSDDTDFDVVPTEGHPQHSARSRLDDMHRQRHHLVSLCTGVVGDVRGAGGPFVENILQPMRCVPRIPMTD